MRGDRGRAGGPVRMELSTMIRNFFESVTPHAVSDLLVPVGLGAVAAVIALIGFPRAALALTPEAESLASAERAFAKTSLDKGMRTAFLTYLSEEGIIFRPHPINGRKWWEGRPEVEGSLAWQPVYVE